MRGGPPKEGNACGLREDMVAVLNEVEHLINHFRSCTYLTGRHRNDAWQDRGELPEGVGIGEEAREKAEWGDWVRWRLTPEHDRGLA